MERHLESLASMPVKRRSGGDWDGLAYSAAASSNRAARVSNFGAIAHPHFSDPRSTSTEVLSFYHWRTAVIQVLPLISNNVSIVIYLAHTALSASTFPRDGVLTKVNYYLSRC